MFNSEFYFGSIRKYVTVFGTLFNDIYITRTDANNDPVETIKVPIAYGPKEPMLARLTQDPNLNRQYAVRLPRMAFEMTTLNYAPDRKLPSILKNIKTVDGSNHVKSQYVPVPFDMTFSLYIMSKNAEDGAKIIEQILPYFTPEYTPTVDLVPEMDIKMDIPLVLINVTSQDTYETNFTDRRALIWTVDFIMKGYFFGPIKKTGLITLADTNFLDGVSNEMLSSVVITPGMDANGSPTSNASNTVSRDQINVNDTYGYVITRT